MNLLLTAITPITWGTTYLITTDVLPPGRPVLAGVMRALPAGLILLLWYRKLPQGLWWIKALILGIVNIGGFFFLLFVTAYLLPGGPAAVITATAPLVVMALSPTLLGTRIHGGQVLAALAAVGGVAALVLGPEASFNPTGVMAAVAATLLTGSGLVLAKKWGKPDDVPQLAVTGWQLTVGGLFLVPFLSIEGIPDHLTATNIAGYSYLTIVGALIAYGLWFRGLALLDAVSVSLLSVLSPLTAIILGVLFKGENFTYIQAIGAAVVLSAAVVSQIIGVRTRAKIKNTTP